MPVTSRATLKSYFPAGGYPTAPQFAQEIDAYVHLSNDNELGIGESLSINAGLQRLFEINNNGPGAIGVGTEADPKYYMKFGDGVRPIQLPLINGFDLPGIVSPIDGMIFYVIDEGYLAHYFDGEWRNIGGVVPVLNFVPLAGTDAGSPITGRIRFEDVDGNETAFVGKNSEDDFGIWSEDSIHLNGFVPGLGATIMRFIDKVNSSGAQMSLNENGFDIYAADFFSGFKGLFANKYFGANYDENTFIQKKYVEQILQGLLKEIFKDCHDFFCVEDRSKVYSLKDIKGNQGPRAFAMLLG